MAMPSAYATRETLSVGEGKVACTGRIIKVTMEIPERVQC
jgi:hypothetical protein